VAHDRHQLLAHEEELRKLLKLKCLGLTSLQRIIARQESRLLWIKEGDTPTCFFHIHANSRHRRRFIHALEREGHSLVSKASKVEALFSFFDDVLGMPSQCLHSIDLGTLDLPRLALSELGGRFKEHEILHVIQELPPDKALGPDSFTACFL
jgi:hypothetical protein